MEITRQQENLNNIKALNYIKKWILLLLFASCSSNDDTKSIDTQLLHGQWFYTDICPSQNNLVLNSNGTYVHTYSGNFCDNNEGYTMQYSGTYSLSGDKITFEEQSNVIIEEGSVGTPPMPTLDILIYSKIIELDENTLVIERKINGESDYFVYWFLYKT